MIHERRFYVRSALYSRRDNRSKSEEELKWTGRCDEFHRRSSARLTPPFAPISATNAWWFVLSINLRSQRYSRDLSMANKHANTFCSPVAWDSVREPTHTLPVSLLLCVFAGVRHPSHGPIRPSSPRFELRVTNGRRFESRLLLLFRAVLCCFRLKDENFYRATSSVQMWTADRG